MLSKKRIANNLTNGYSDLVFSFLKKYYKDLSLNDKVLDVGCGHYRNLKLFNELGFEELYGIDINTTNNPLKVDVNFIQKDIQEGLPYSDKSFQIVLCNYVLMFIKLENINFVLNELLRVCKNYLIIETYPKKSINSFQEKYDFKNIAEYIKNNKEFEIINQRNYYEKLLIRRKEDNG